MRDHRVVILRRLGVTPVLGLKRAPVEITLIDSRNFGHDEWSAHAVQQGHYAARAVRGRLKGRSAPPFRYRDKGKSGHHHAAERLRRDPPSVQVRAVTVRVTSSLARPTG
jgi:hypothetical protein